MRKIFTLLLIYIITFNNIAFSQVRRRSREVSRFTTPLSVEQQPIVPVETIEVEPVVEIIEEEKEEIIQPSLLNIMQQNQVNTISSATNTNLKTTQLINEIKQRYTQKLDETRNACSGIAKELDSIRSLATGTTVLSGVGTLAAGAALTTGLMKSSTDKKSEENEKRLAEIEDEINKKSNDIQECLTKLEELGGSAENITTLDQCEAEKKAIAQKNCIVIKLDECSTRLTALQNEIGFSNLKLATGTPPGYQYLGESSRGDFCAEPGRPVYGVGSDGKISEALEWMFKPQNSCITQKGYSERILSPESASGKLEKCMKNLALFQEIKKNCQPEFGTEKYINVIANMDANTTSCTEIQNFSLDNVCSVDMDNLKYTSSCNKYSPIKDCGGKGISILDIPLRLSNVTEKNPVSTIESLENEKQDILNEQANDLKKSKTLGHIRSATMGVATLTSAGSTATSAVNISKSSGLIEKIKTCNNKLVELKAIGAELKVELDAAGKTDAITLNIDAVNQNCFSIDTKNLEKVKNLSIGSTVTSAIGTLTGAAGTTTSILANTDKVRDDKTEEGIKKEKNLNTASNILAGVTMGTSAASTALGGITVATVKKEEIENANRCEQALNQ